MAAFMLTVRTAVRGYRPNEKDLGRFAIAELHCRTKRKMNDIHTIEKAYKPSNERNNARRTKTTASVVGFAPRLCSLAIAAILQAFPMNI